MPNDYKAHAFPARLPPWPSRDPFWFAPKGLYARMARADEDRTAAIVACAGVVLAPVAAKKVLDGPAKDKDQ